MNSFCFLHPFLTGLKISIIDFDTNKPPVQLPGGDTGRGNAHEHIKDDVMLFACDVYDMLQNWQWLLGRMLRTFQPLKTHADRAFEKVVHLVLSGEIPGMAFVPHTDDQFTAV
jgi:hypothetical protein